MEILLEGGEGFEQESERQSVPQFKSFLKSYRTELMGGGNGKGGGGGVFDDQGRIGTSQQDAFSLGNRSGKDSILAGFAHTIVDYFSEGVFTLVVTNFLKYVMVAVIHVVFYVFIPDLGLYVQEIDWDTSFLLLNFVVAFIIQGDIRTAVSRFSQHPRAAFGIFRKLIQTSLELCSMQEAAITDGPLAPNNSNDNSDRVRVKQLFIEAQLDLVHLTKWVVGFFKEMETSGDTRIRDAFEKRMSNFFSMITRLRYHNIITGDLEVFYRQGFRQQVEPILSEAGFAKRFIPNTLVSNHLKLVILIYLWIFVPVQLFASTGVLVIFIYPMMMLIFDMVHVLDELQGQPFSFENGRYHPNDYRTWENDALERIYRTCLLANLDRPVSLEEMHGMIDRKQAELEMHQYMD